MEKRDKIQGGRHLSQLLGPQPLSDSDGAQMQEAFYEEHPRCGLQMRDLLPPRPRPSHRTRLTARACEIS